MKPIDIKSLFLGPKAENQELYESIVIEAIRDNCFLRKNFHPEDKPIISEQDKIEFQESTAEFKQKLQEILADLKKGVPLYHPRYIGHMHGDLLLPSVVAYFSTMLYNSNNVVGESSPATTKMEFEYMRNMCKMAGYQGFVNTEVKDAEGNGLEQSWGHLCSGGHTANIEALWIARNMKYYPLSVKLAIQKNTDGNDVGKFLSHFNENCEINYFGKNKHLQDLSYSELFNLQPSDILELKQKLYNDAEYYAKENENGLKKETEKEVEKILKEVKKRIDDCSVTTLGVHGIHNAIFKENKEALPLPKLYIAKSNHYSWQKAMDIVGLGHKNFIGVEMTPEFSMDFENLKNRIQADNSPILAVVGILGSSKQGSIDPLDEIVKFRNDLKQSNKSFYFHIDAAYGGYFPSILWESSEPKNNGKGDEYNLLPENTVCKFLSEIELKDKDNDSLLGIKRDIQTRIKQNTKKIYPRLTATKEADSITIDPHKMGYLPYPAGSVLFKDTRSKDFISYEPSYLNKPSNDSDEYNAFIGQWTLEGSRPGAAAAACYLSNRILPFNQSGYGLLVKNTFQMANLFMCLIEKFNLNSKLNRGYRIFPMYEQPESNIVEYILVNTLKIIHIKYLNILKQNLYDQFCVKGKSVIPSKNFMVAKEDFEVEDIHDNVWKRLKTQGSIIKPTYKDEVKPLILSSVFMNPLSIYIDGVEEYYMNFFKKMVEYADEIAMPNILFEQIRDNNNGERLKVLWVENEKNAEQLKRVLLYKSNVGQYLDIDFKLCPSDSASAESAVKDKDYKIIILDLNLKNAGHDNGDVTDENLKEAIDLYKSICNEDKSKVIFCSEFFNKEETKKLVMQKLSDIDFTDESRMIGKPKKENRKEINFLINSIFAIFTNHKTGTVRS
jgi:glutamate/tyrosine decarboxylase-like PLP-dependent enzyme